MKKSNLKTLDIRGATGEIRTEKLDGRDHLVVPIVALVEGVIWPINMPKPEFASAEAFGGMPQGWNGRPVFAGHPVNSDGEQISGNNPKVLESAVGKVFNARVEGKRLLMEAWVDIDKTQKLGGEQAKMLERLQAIQAGKSKEIVEVSVGAFVVDDEKPGAYQGKKYASTWKDVAPDHLALLPIGNEGACNADMGCGVRAAQKHFITSDGTIAMGGDMDQEYRNCLAALEPSELQEFQAHPFSYCMDTVVPAIERKGKTVSDPNAFCGWWKQENSQAYEAAMSRALQAHDSTFQDLEALGDDYVVYARQDANLYRVCYGVKDKKIVFTSETVAVEPIVYYEPVEGLRAAKGARHSQKDMASIQAMHDYSVELGATCAPKTMAAKPCGCHDKEGESMTKEQRETKVKSLRAKAEAINKAKVGEFEAAKKSGDLFDAIISQITSKPPYTADDASWLADLDEGVLMRLAGIQAPDDPSKADGTKPDMKTNDGEASGGEGKAKNSGVPSYGDNAKGGAHQIEMEKKQMTEAEFLAAAPESIKQMFEEKKTQDEARKTELVKALLGAQTEYSEADLKGMELKTLERHARAFKVNERRPVDFGGQGAPRNEQKVEAAPAPPNMFEILQGKNKK